MIPSGGPASVRTGLPGPFVLGVPTLGICYGMHPMQQLAAASTAAPAEFGKTELNAGESEPSGIAADQTVWMSHRDPCPPPTEARVVAGSAATPIAAFEDDARGLYGIQFHPRSHTRTAAGAEELPYGIAGVSPLDAAQ